MKKSIIGVVPLVDEEKESYWMLPGYMKGIMAAGAIAVMLPLTTNKEDIEQIAEQMDGFLFTGGQDVNPALYNEPKTKLCGASCNERDEMESMLFKKVYELDKPILGICRGIQIINALMGGTLYQDLPSEHTSTTEHHQKPPYDKPIHEVSVDVNSPLYDLLKTESLKVNSYHHQAIKTLGKGLKKMALSEDGLVEAVCAENKKFIWAFQWHPEFSFEVNEDSRKIFNEFIAHC